jgi:hypothetical protein
MRKPVTANALRRFHFATLEAGGVDLDEVRDRAGLADVRSVRRYIEPQCERHVRAD